MRLQTICIVVDSRLRRPADELSLVEKSAINCPCTAVMQIVLVGGLWIAVASLVCCEWAVAQIACLPRRSHRSLVWAVSQSACLPPTCSERAVSQIACLGGLTDHLSVTYLL